MKDFRDYQEVVTLDGLCRLVVFKDAPPSSSRRLQLSIRAEFAIEVSPVTSPQELPRNTIHVGQSREKGFLAFQAITRCSQIIGFDLSDAAAVLGGGRVSVHQVWANRSIGSLELTSFLLPHLKKTSSRALLAFHLPESFEDALPFVVYTMGTPFLREFIGFISYASPDQERIGVTALASYATAHQETLE